MKLLYYDDEFRHLDNKLLCLRLRMEVPQIEIDYVHSVEVFEMVIKKFNANVIILDLMGPDTMIKEYDTGNSVAAENIGIELLRRIRGGYYPGVSASTLVAIRTAKNDPKTRKICKQLGANHFCCAGMDDAELIEFVREASKKS